VGTNSILECKWLSESSHRTASGKGLNAVRLVAKGGLLLEGEECRTSSGKGLNAVRLVWCHVANPSVDVVSMNVGALITACPPCPGWPSAV
jgi:hypothetical protein